MEKLNKFVQCMSDFGGWMNVTAGVGFIALFALYGDKEIEIPNLEVLVFGIALIGFGFGSMKNNRK